MSFQGRVCTKNSVTEATGVRECVGEVFAFNMVPDIRHWPPSEHLTQGAIKPGGGLFLQNKFVEIFGGSNLETLNKQRMEFFISKSCTLYLIELILFCAYQHAFHRLSLLSGLESRSRIDM